MKCTNVPTKARKKKTAGKQKMHANNAGFMFYERRKYIQHLYIVSRIHTVCLGEK